MMTQIRSQWEGKTLMKNETHFPLITEPPSNLAAGTAIFCSLFASKDKYNIQGVGLLAWNCEMLRMFFCVEMDLVNGQLKILLKKPLLIWCDWLDFTPALWFISHALLWLASTLIPSLIPLFLPSFPHGIQRNLPPYLPVWWLWKGDGIPHSF